MKRFLVGGIAVVALALGGCAGSIVKDPESGAVTVDVTKSEGAAVTHEDILDARGVALASADKATDPALKAALKARAQKYLAFDTLLTAHEGQASACVNAILAMKPPAPTNAPGADGKPHAFRDFEIAAETLGQLQGLTPAAKLACADLPIPFLGRLKPL